MCGAMRIAYPVGVHGRFDAVAEVMGAIGKVRVCVTRSDASNDMAGAPRAPAA
jgi:hypothetical protein